MAKTEKLELRYIPVSTLARWERNPKRHDLGKIAESIRRYGFKDPPKYEPTLNQGRGAIAAGNGRATVLLELQERGEKPPRGIAVDAEGQWLAPVLFGIDAATRAEAEGYALDHNALVMAGGNLSFEDTLQVWDEEALVALLRDAPDVEKLLVSFDSDALTALLSGPDFQPVVEDDQPRLDQKSMITCPECGHEFRR